MTFWQMLTINRLPQGDKAKLLSELAAKVFAHAVGS